MSVLRTAKLLTLGVGRSIGIFDALRRSEWRKNRLLIIAYHGVSQDDEHLWDPELFLSPEGFANRMQALRDYGCNVLSLSEGLQRLWSKTLPSCSVVLTFDDGGADFYSQAFPILREFGWTATIYLASYYSTYNRPVFDCMCSYLLWKARDRVFDSRGLLNNGTSFDLTDKSARAAAARSIRIFARQSEFSAKQKDDFLGSIAGRLEVDYETILAKRILHLLSPKELEELCANGVDIQLHTHRHHAPKTRKSFLTEIEENRNFIVKFTKLPNHFSYPHGFYEECFESWLSYSHVASATTCEPGLATKDSNPYKLPRLVDTSVLNPIELEGWISGFSKFLPRRHSNPPLEIAPYYY